MRASKLTLMVASLGAIKTAEGPQAMRDPTRPLVPMAEYVPPKDLDEFEGFYYPTEYRVLNCWECFQSQGKMCIEQSQNHDALLSHTTSREKGNAFCCK